MLWVAPAGKDVANATLEKSLWDTADQFRANSGLKPQEYSGPILGLIFLRFAEVRFARQLAKLEKAGASSRRGSRVDEPAAYHAESILFLTPHARFDHLLALPEAADVGKAVNEAMRDIEKHNPRLGGVLPKTYNLFTSTLLKELLKKVSEIPATVDYDAPHNTTGRFDFMLANPPFNVNAVDKEPLKDSVGAGRRFPFGLPQTDNANHLWIQLFSSALNAKGRAGTVFVHRAAAGR
jgi:type I restriction-modification system DNA methylase subunit